MTDELWEVIRPLLPEEAPKPKVGRPRAPDRALLTGILLMLRTGILWEISQASGWGGTGEWWGGTSSRLNHYRRLKVHYEPQADGHQAFLELGCVLI